MGCSTILLGGGGGAVLNNHCALSAETSNPRRVNSCPGNMKALQSFKTSGITHPVTQYYIPKGFNRQCCCQNHILVMSEHFCLMINTAFPAFMRACENMSDTFLLCLTIRNVNLTNCLKRSHTKNYSSSTKQISQ